MRSAALALSCALLLGACGPEFLVVPQGGAPQLTASASGVTMTAFANRWDASPYDLADYLTPIAVDLYNGSASEIRVSYADFALRDESGFRFHAINPFLPANLSERDPGEPPAALGEGARLYASNGPILVAARSGGGGGGHVSVGRVGAAMVGTPGGGAHALGARPGGVTVPPPTLRRGPGGGYGGWPGFTIYGGGRGYYGGPNYWWGGPFYPAYYWDWVFWWGPRYYPAPRPSDDVVEFGLPEGVLSPGGHVGGFVYFQNATRHAHRLDLAWELQDARTHSALGAAHVALEVVKR